MNPIIPFPGVEGQFSHLYSPPLVNRYLEQFSEIDRLLVGTDCAYMAQKYGRRIGVLELNAAVRIARVLDACTERGVRLAAKTLHLPDLCADGVREQLEAYISVSHAAGDSFVEGLRIALVGWGNEDASFIESQCSPESSRNMFYYKDAVAKAEPERNISLLTNQPRGKRLKKQAV